MAEPFSTPEEFLALPAGQKREVHFRLCRQALARWEAFAAAQPGISYIESVVGTLQEVDMQLPRDALAAAELGRPAPEIAHRYLEPITAMQDDDLSFPGPVMFAYYAIYNLFRKYAQHDPIDDWLIVNQAQAGAG